MRACKNLIALSCLVFALMASSSGCQKKTETPPDKAPVVAAKPQLDFDAILTAVEGVAGNRFQSMNMDFMQSTSYQYSGPLEPILEIVAPQATAAGFSELPVDMGSLVDENMRAMQQKTGVDMQNMNGRVFTHPEGSTLTVSRVDVSNQGMDLKLLTIQLMNTKKMTEFSKTQQAPAVPPAAPAPAVAAPAAAPPAE